MAVEITPLFAVPGGMELVVVLLIAVLLFGANKIPKLARSTGEAMGEFQKGREEVEQELQEIREGADVDTDIDTDIDTDLDTDTTTSSADTEAETETETDK
ncbi:twin-arginine translocase TatA/TatE family subunit [Natranaeroarchaeum aerophilus]|uniref:Twin-arginine translocase TatA/TatE family subunit n=1 Tax=Natranaeroarchaeum aerophilus TaxID=2917711 RepID=A0AAE3K6P6_9EURY|nr:twin-arginine translocase TatA/TatE family subunit [Natranaeroarchaeum aerophilus]MCL9815218.1 twin-arginine translocase TatA/TatE family subunit [Natranaeroarchaeum aerophilus]